MSWTVEYIPEKRWVSIVASGEITDEDCRAQVAKAIPLLHEHESNLLWVDCSGVATNASLAGVYRLPDYATELGAPWNIRVAVVTPKTRLRIEVFQFFELVCRNAGYDVRLFDDRPSAEEWLWHPPPVQAAAPQLASL